MGSFVTSLNISSTYSVATDGQAVTVHMYHPARASRSLVGHDVNHDHASITIMILIAPHVQSKRAKRAGMITIFTLAIESHSHLLGLVSQ